jgi:hypothetical protein
MKREGPSLETLTRRLAECPPEFLALPRVGETGAIHVDAVVSDLLRELGGEGLSPEAARQFQSRNRKADRARLSVVLLAGWLLHDAWFRDRPGFAEPALQLLRDGLRELAATTPAARFVADPDRREELARVCLSALGLRPAGESIAQAQDRLATLNAAERQRVVSAARQAEERAQKIREAMKRQAQEEANAKAMRE